MSSNLTASATTAATDYRSFSDRSSPSPCPASSVIADSVGPAGYSIIEGFPRADEHVDANMNNTHAADARQHHMACEMVVDAGEAVAVSADGRVARRQRNRQRVVEAYVRLLRDGVAEPTASELAAIAEVTPRTVYRYMREDATLNAEVADRIVPTFRCPFSSDESAPLSLRDRIDVFISYRLDAHELSAPMMQVFRSHLAKGPVAMIAIEAEMTAVREQLTVCFAPELQHLLAADQLVTVTSLQILVLFDALEHLFDRLGPERSVIHEVLCRNLYAIVSVVK